MDRCRHPMAPRRATNPTVILLGVLMFPTGGAAHIDDEEIRYVLPPDAIPAITQPKFDTGDWLEADDKVIGFEHEGDARAYPLRVLVWHEIVDDTVGGLPVAVTYCPLCGTGIVFDRRVGDETLTFKVSGRLYKSDLVMYDAETNSLWTQVLGEAIQGDFHGRALTPLGATLATWEDWRARHPGAPILSRDTGHDRDYARDPYAGYDSQRRIGISDENRGDVRGMHPKEFVLGFEENGDAIAFRHARLAPSGFAQVAFHDRSLLATMVEGAANLFDATGRLFVALDAGVLHDAAAGTWDPLTGTSGQGEALVRLPGIPAFWFAWFDFHPDTIVWGAFGIEKMSPADGAGPVNPTTPVVLEFSAPVDDSQRDGIHDLVAIEPATTATFEWSGPTTLTIRADAGWPFGRTTVSIDGSLRDENGTAMEVGFNSSFTVAEHAAPGPTAFALLALLAAVVLTLVHSRKSRP